MAFGYDGSLYLLAFGHRGSFQKQLFGIARDPTPQARTTAGSCSSSSCRPRSPSSTLSTETRRAMTPSSAPSSCAGRSNELQDFLDGSLDQETTAGEIAERYLRFVKVYADAEAATRV